VTVRPGARQRSHGGQRAAGHHRQLGAHGGASPKKCGATLATRAPDPDPGESGTGKDSGGQGRPRAWGARWGPYVPLNVGAIAESLADSEAIWPSARRLQRGAVGTSAGALSSRLTQGTLFLGRRSPSFLSAFRCVCWRCGRRRCAVRPLGAHTSSSVDVRIVLRQAGLRSGERVEDGRFRWRFVSSTVDGGRCSCHHWRPAP